ncbi:MAG: hypothetical protein HUJ76_04500 [Parasporobacterium sp.]|nr:hypothetical protein [Parasporobacterium sp.]
MKKILTLILCVVLAAAVMTGCGAQKEEETTAPVVNDPAVAGTWTEPDFDSGYVFNEDGTGRDIFWDITFTYTAADGELVITYDDEKYGKDRYSYMASETELTMTRSTESDKSFTYTKK